LRPSPPRSTDETAEYCPVVAGWAWTAALAALVVIGGVLGNLLSNPLGEWVRSRSASRQVVIYVGTGVLALAIAIVLAVAGQMSDESPTTGTSNRTTSTSPVITVPPSDSPTTPRTTAPPPTTRDPQAAATLETAWGPPGGSVPLFSGAPGINVDGGIGPAATLQVGAQVLVDCKRFDQQVAASNDGGYWYHLVDGPHPGFWAPASLFENRGGAWPTVGANVDSAVPDC
jgi:hypothetical protein